MVALRQVVCSRNFEIPVSSETGIFLVLWTILILLCLLNFLRIPRSP